MNPERLRNLLRNRRGPGRAPRGPSKAAKEEGSGKLVSYLDSPYFSRVLLIDRHNPAQTAVPPHKPGGLSIHRPVFPLIVTLGQQEKVARK
jgi:hypothetical protein